MKWSDSTFAWELGIDVEYWTEPQDERAVVAPGLLKDVVGLTNPVFPHRLNLVAYPSLRFHTTLHRAFLKDWVSKEYHDR